MIKILSIGNSFSQDAQRYIYQIAKKEGQEFKVENLMIGGCPLERHFRNMYSDSKEYILEINGEDTGYFVSLKEAILSDSWDVITLQQASNFSFKEESYEPYASELSKYIRKYCPKAKIYVHETWAYESNTPKIRSVNFEKMEEMSKLVFPCYEKMAKSINADGIIRDGEAMLELSLTTNIKAHRDTLHATFGLGRYMLGCIWYQTLTGKKVEKEFEYFDEEVSKEDVLKVKEIANKYSIINKK